MQGIEVSPELELISSSLENTVGRLQFLRVAFGLSDPNQVLPRAEIQNILSRTFDGGRIGIDWTPLVDPPRPSVCIVFLLLLCLESSMPIGGRITVSEAEGTWTMEAHTMRLDVDTPLWGYLRRDLTLPEPTSRNLHFLLAMEQLAAQNRSVSVELSNTGALLRF